MVRGFLAITCEEARGVSKELRVAGHDGTSSETFVDHNVVRRFQKLPLFLDADSQNRGRRAPEPRRKLTTITTCRRLPSQLAGGTMVIYISGVKY